MEQLPADALTPEGRRVTLTRDDWLHISFRHPEVGLDPAAILRAVSSPDETHRGGRGEYHALKRIDASHFVVVIYELGEGGGLIRTAFIINEKRKERRYKEP